MMIDAVVFDLGGVVIHWDPALAYPEMSGEEFSAFARRTRFHERNAQADAGVLWGELAARVGAETAPGDANGPQPGDSDLIASYPQRFHRTVHGPIEGMADLVARLRERGLGVFGLTNWSAQTFAFGVAAVPLVATFDDVLVSGREGLIKPDERIFTLALERFRLSADRTLFVDDREENVVAARRIGMIGHVFTSAEALKLDLQRLR